MLMSGAQGYTPLGDDLVGRVDGHMNDLGLTYGGRDRSANRWMCGEEGGRGKRQKTDVQMGGVEGKPCGVHGGREML